MKLFPHLAALVAALLAALPLAAAQDSPQALVERGRAALEAGRIDEALAAFQEAVAGEDSDATRPWLIRARIAAGEIEEALAATEEYEAAGAPEGIVAYLYGMGFRALALREASEGGTGQTALVFADAFDWLQQAANAQAPFPDLLEALAECAWYSQFLEAAGHAIAAALDAPEADRDTLTLGGRIALSRYQVAQEAGDADTAATHLAAARERFEASVADAAPKTAEDRTTLADRWVQLGYVHLYAEDPAGAAHAFGEATAWAPEALDLGYVQSVLEPQVFLETITAARAAHRERLAEDATGDALLTWWLAYAQFALNTRADRERAEATFLEALELNPDFANSWYYIARARYTQQEMPGTIEALSTYDALDPDGLVAYLQGSERDVWMVEGLIGWCAGGRGEPEGPPDNETAAALCEILTRVQPDVARHWNNMGLFLRDAGDLLERSPAADRSGTRARRCLALWEGSLEAYRSALALDPENPIYLNDTAVVLHYNLGRELEEARSLYGRALELAGRELEKTDLSTDQRETFEMVLRDAGQNQRLLERQLERRSQPKSAKG